MFKRGLPPLAISLGLEALLLLLPLLALGDPTLLTISNASVTVTSSSSTTLDFPISHGGDTS